MVVRVVDNRRAWLVEANTRGANCPRRVRRVGAKPSSRGADCPRHVWRIGAVLSLGMASLCFRVGLHAARSSPVSSVDTGRAVLSLASGRQNMCVIVGAWSGLGSVLRPASYSAVPWPIVNS